MYGTWVDQVNALVGQSIKDTSRSIVEEMYFQATCTDIERLVHGYQEYTPEEKQRTKDLYDDRFK